MHTFWSACVIGTLILLFTVPALAQRNPTDVISQGTAYRVFAQPGESTIEVLVLGDVGSGVYVIGEGINLSRFLALIGGAGGQRTSTDVVVKTTIRLLREEGGQRNVVYEARLEELLRDPAAYPSLTDGDIFTVENEARRRFSLRETLSIVSSLTSITLLILRLTDGGN